MELCVLGLLMQREMSLYDIRQAFAQYLSLFYSDSLGSLQVTIRKLEARGCVTKRAEYVGKRRKDVLTLTATGKTEFFHKMLEPLALQRLEVDLLTRLYFMGWLPANERQRVAANGEQAIVASLHGLEKVEGELNVLDIPDAFQPVFRYQRATLSYGLMSHRASLQWWRDNVLTSTDQ